MNEPSVVLLALAAAALAVLLVRERVRSREQAHALFERFRREELGRLETELSRSLELRSEAALDRFKLEEERRIRDDAVRRSQAVVSGKTAEQLVPFLPEFPFDPKDARFLGSPIDLVVFDGMSADSLREIVFVEVKTGPAAGLTKRERRIRDAVEEGRVRFHELHLKETDANADSANLFLPLRADDSGISGQLEICTGRREIRYWSDWSEPPLVYPLDPELLVRIDERRYGLKLVADGRSPSLTLEADVRLLVDSQKNTLSIQFGEQGEVSYLLEPERIVYVSGTLLLSLDGRR